MPSSAPYGISRSYDGRSTIQLGFKPLLDDDVPVPFGEYVIQFIVSRHGRVEFLAVAGGALTVDPLAGVISVVIPPKRLCCGAHNIQLVWTEIATGVVSVHIDGSIQVDGEY